MRDLGVADIAVHGQRMLGSQITRPIYRAHRFIEWLGRCDSGFQDGPENADRGSQPEIGLIEERLISGKVDATTAGLDVNRLQITQLVRQHRLESSGTGREVPLWVHKLACQELRLGPADEVAGRVLGVLYDAAVDHDQEYPESSQDELDAREQIPGTRTESAG